MAVLTDRNIRNIFIYAVPKFSAYVLNFLTLPILTRLLYPDDFGLVAFIQIFPTIIVSIVTLGLVSSPGRYYFKYRTDEYKLNAYLFLVQLFLFASLLLSSIGIYALKDVISRLVIRKDGYGFAVFIGYISVFLTQIIGFYLIVYQYMEKAVHYSAYNISQAVITSLCSLVLVWYFKLSYMGLIYGSLTGSIIVCGVLLYNFNRTIKARFDLKILVKSITYGIQVIPKTFSGFINRIFDKYMLNNMVSLSAVGVYNISQNLGNALSMIMSSVSASFFPVGSKEIFDKGEKGAVSAGRLFTILAYLSIAPCLLVLLFSQEIIFILAPPSYYEAVDLLIIIAAAVSSFAFGKYVGMQYTYSRKVYLIYPITLAATIANVAANIILIPRYGLIGAAFSMFISAWVSNILITFIGQKLYKLKYEWNIIIYLNLCITAAMLIMLLLRYLGQSIFVQYFFKLLFIGLYIVIGMKAGIVNKSNIKKFPGLFLFRKAENNSALT